MSDVYIPWWLPPDDPRRRPSVAEIVPHEPDSVSGAAASPEPEPPEAPLDPAEVNPSPDTPAELLAAQAYVAGQGSE